ncbi:hypothetical protein L1987_13144 [Smallanthus sonchifolius]|uniref:Uncharacterized protein n=1 Tax=Smallanthus sonchifolius TaxID=185202 RepID=A0ACB9JGQ4_9ASTR|nr:hypothetical protein L1987_13144 [Smallanthus sonchifolius]
MLLFLQRHRFFKIHTIDAPQPSYLKPLGDSAVTSGTKPSVAGVSNPRSKKNLVNPTELKGVVHLFRNLQFTSSYVNPVITLWNVATRTTVMFIVVVPNYLSDEEFISFCGRHVDEFTDLCFIRNDALEDRYSMLIKLTNQAADNGFCISYYGKRFSPSEVLLINHEINFEYLVSLYA